MPIATGDGALVGLLAGLVGAGRASRRCSDPDRHRDGAHRARDGACAWLDMRRQHAAGHARHDRSVQPAERRGRHRPHRDSPGGRRSWSCSSSARSSRRSAVCSAPRSSARSRRPARSTRRPTVASGQGDGSLRPFAVTDAWPNARSRSAMPKSTIAPSRRPRVSAAAGLARAGARQRPGRSTPRRPRSRSVLGRASPPSSSGRALDTRPRLAAAAREVVRRRPAQRQRQLPRSPRPRTRAATRPRSSGKASPAIAAR